MTDPEGPPDAVVVGSGVSGLTAAHDLAAAGRSVIVLEARDRIGGRTWTHDLAGAPVDLGGSWIHGPTGNPLAEHVRELGMTWRNDGMWGTGMSLYREDGTPTRHDEVASLVAALADFDPAEAAAHLPAGASFVDAADWYVRDRNLHPDHAAVARFAIEWLEGALNVGGMPDTISPAGVASYVLHGGGNVVLDGGYRTLVDHLADGLDIRCSSPVAAIEHGPTGCIVTFESEAQASISATDVIVTVPLPILQQRRISFTPDLPGHLGAADRLAMANLEKVVLRFDRAFWPTAHRRATFLTGDHRFPTWVDMTVHAGAPTLVGFLNPHATPGLLDHPAEERVGLALAVLRRAFPDLPDPIAAHCTDWTDDTWSCGSYSYVPVGATPDDMALLATSPSAHLHFAGEHTVPDYFGTVHGAFVSGRRAARQVLGAGARVPHV